MEPVSSRSVVVQVRLIVRAAAVDRVEIEAWRAKIFQRIRVVLLLQRAVRIERQIVIDELTEVGVSSRNRRIFVTSLRFTKGRIQELSAGLHVLQENVGSFAELFVTRHVRAARAQRCRLQLNHLLGEILEVLTLVRLAREPAEHTPKTATADARTVDILQPAQSAVTARGVLMFLHHDETPSWSDAPEPGYRGSHQNEGYERRRPSSIVIRTGNPRRSAEGRLRPRCNP